MEFRADLLKQNRKSPRMILLGLITLCFSIFTLVRHHLVITMHHAPLLDAIVYSLVFGIGGVFTYAGFGWSLTRLLGKAFIAMDHKGISIKTRVLGKTQRLLWRDIKSIECRSDSIFIVQNNEKHIMVDLSILSNDLQKEILNTLMQMQRSHKSVPEDLH